MSWYEAVATIESHGSGTERPGSLAGLAAARRSHLGQFFTPNEVSRLMWRIAQPAMAILRARSPETKISILDNSVGSGRLLQFAEPDRHALFGVDIDAGAVGALGTAATQAGFDCQFEACGMETIRPHGMAVGLINPPFSLNLQSPWLESYPCVTYGKFGPDTAALSHAYALAQAVDACQIVIALLPARFAEEVAAHCASYLREGHAARLRAHLGLPPHLFREQERTDVRVSLLVFDANAGATGLIDHNLESLSDPLPDLGLAFYAAPRRAARLGVQHLEDEGPAITRAVTGDNRVRVVHDGRKIGLRFACGMIEAKVLNAVLRARVESEAAPEHRLPKAVRYSGQGVLDLEVHLAQENPHHSFATFLEAIRTAGGAPEVEPGLVRYFHRRVRQHAIEATPLRHTVWTPHGAAGDGARMHATAKKTHVADAQKWGSPLISAGQPLSFTRETDGTFSFELAGARYQLSAAQLAERFEVTDGARQPGWRTVHEGLAQHFPEQAAEIAARARTLGIDHWLSWGYQFDDLVELMLEPRGAIVAWHMGLGKARLALALVLLSGCRHGLITVEACLIDELILELRGLPAIPSATWQVITRSAQLERLRQINIISYERLRLPLRGRNTEEAPARLRMRTTYAGRLRRRCGVVVSDEGELLSSPLSQQSRALWHVSGKRRFVLTGTPLANVPRDVLPTQAYCCGDGTAAQPWGWHRGYLERNWRKSMAHAERGVDAFRNRFVTLDWSTREWDDTMVSGAKREIPRIQHLDEYRALIAPHIKRRVLKEPDVAKFVQIPDPIKTVIELPWDDSHLAYYLDVAEQFAAWYTQQRNSQGRSSNLMAVLAKIRAVSFASDYPQHNTDGFGSYGPLTTKQRWAIARLSALTKQGAKTILYAENPGNLELIQRELQRTGIDSLLHHGGLPRASRTKALYERFRFGDCPNLLASVGVTKRGLNLPQADHVIMLSRSWKATAEDQAISRPLRPQQTENVCVEFAHLAGGIDIYKAQAVAFKADSAAAGLDWATPETDDIPFLHLDTIIDRFIRNLAALRGMSRRGFRDSLRVVGSSGTAQASKLPLSRSMEVNSA